MLAEFQLERGRLAALSGSRVTNRGWRVPGEGARIDEAARRAEGSGRGSAALARRAAAHDLLIDVRTPEEFAGFAARRNACARRSARAGDGPVGGGAQCAARAVRQRRRARASRRKLVEATRLRHVPAEEGTAVNVRVAPAANLCACRPCRRSPWRRCKTLLELRRTRRLRSAGRV